MSPRPVHALLINENIGGHATVHHHLARVAARRADLRVRIVNVPPPGFWRKVAGVAVPGLARMDADVRAARYQLAQSAWVSRRLRGWIAGDGDVPFDVVHLYTHNAALLAGRVLRTVPYVVTIDSTNAQSNLMHPVREPTRFSGLSTSMVRPLERAVYARAWRVVANSHWCARSLIAEYDLDPQRIEVLPMGVAVPETANLRRTDAGLPKVVFVGRTMGRKGGFELLRVHQRWLSQRCELVVVTQEPVPGGRNVTVVGDVVPGDGRIGALLADADLLVLPSRVDQWPNAVMEAMSHGVVPVVSDVGGLPEMVLHGRAGVVLPDRAPETLRDVIAGLLDDPTRRAALGARARRRVVEDLDVQRTANLLLDIVRDAGSSTGAAEARL
jgi:starch synthase